MKKLLLSLSLIASFSTISAQWTAQGTGFFDVSRGLNEIKIVDANTVWALAFDGAPLTVDHPETLNVTEFTVTTDGGASWTSGVIDFGNSLIEINNISPVDGLTAWVSALDPAASGGVIYKTTDGGGSWNRQLSTGFTTPNDSFLNGVYFWNANEGIAYGDPLGTGSNRRFEIYRTTNGGTSWAAITGAALPTALAAEYGYNNSPIVVGNTIWITTSKGRLFKSLDKGVTWTVSQTPVADFGGYSTPGTRADVYFSNQSNGFLKRQVGSAAPFVYTTWTTADGGLTWQGGTPYTGTRHILSYIPGTTTLVATSLAAPVGTAVSTDNGTTWTDVETAAQRGANAFLNATTGWCGGFSTTDPLTGGIFKLTGTLGTQTIGAKAKYTVFPNPASSTVTITVADADSYNLSVTDLSGKVVMTKSLSGMENTLDISALATGAYFFNLSTDNQKEVVKILKN